MSDGLNGVGVGAKKLSALDQENRREAAAEKALEKYLGTALPRCPVCGGRRRKHALGRACAYCGSVRSD